MRIGSLVRDTVGDIGVVLYILPPFQHTHPDAPVARVKFIVGDSGTYTLSQNQLEVLCE